MEHQNFIAKKAETSYKTLILIHFVSSLAEFTWTYESFYLSSFINLFYNCSKENLL